eukprot:gene12055-16131_t
MEEDDDFVPEPDAKGSLVISNRAWVTLDPSIWTMSAKLIRLDMSYNHIKAIPPQIGELIMLRELIASFNKIVYVPPEIGKLKRLKKIILNSNRLTSLPDEIGLLENLEEIIVSENSIDVLPSTVSKMSTLKVLKIANNKLKTLPFELADIFTLEELDVGNNPDLDIVPPKWRGDTESVLFMCRVHRDNGVRLNEALSSNENLAKHSQHNAHETLRMKETIADLYAKIEILEKNMPPKTLKKIENEARLLEEMENRAILESGKKKDDTCCIIC